MNRFKNPRLMMIFSMTIFGTLGVFVRNIPVSSGELALYRAVLATLSYYFAPVIVTVVCPFLFKEKLSGKQILCFLMSTVGLLHTGITYCLYFSALKELPGQKAAILSYIDP